MQIIIITVLSLAKLRHASAETVAFAAEVFRYLTQCALGESSRDQLSLSVTFLVVVRTAYLVSHAPEHSAKNLCFAASRATHNASLVRIMPVEITYNGQCQPGLAELCCHGMINVEVVGSEQLQLTSIN